MFYISLFHKLPHFKNKCKLTPKEFAAELPPLLVEKLHLLSY